MEPHMIVQELPARWSNVINWRVLGDWIEVRLNWRLALALGLTALWWVCLLTWLTFVLGIWS